MCYLMQQRVASNRGAAAAPADPADEEAMIAEAIR